jgi:hypothetical protein
MGSLTEHNARASAGPERRRDQVLVTQNSEYHCRNGACIGVRDRRTGDFVPDHPALGKWMAGGMWCSIGGGIESATPPGAIFIGEQICFSSCDGHLEHDVITSPLLSIEQPSSN